MSTNYLGPVALTGLAAAGAAVWSRKPRLVQVSSLAQRQGSIDFEDFQLERKYSPWKAFCQSKLSMLMFAMELQKRSDAGGWRLLSAAAHPGYVATGSMANAPTARYRIAKMGLMFLPLLRPIGRRRCASPPPCGHFAGCDAGRVLRGDRAV